MSIQSIIQGQAQSMGITVDPRHVEGNLILAYGGTSHVDIETIKQEILVTDAMMALGETALLERTAQSYGL